MDRQSILKTACLVAATLLAAACTQDELSDGQGKPLPEGRYPLAFTATQAAATASPQTRVADYDEGGATKSRWTNGDQIAVKVENDGVKEYTPATGGSSSATLQAAFGVEPFYWRTSNETKTISAWYCGTGYNATLPTTWTVQSDQSTKDGYLQSDFLYAAASITFTDRNKTPLKFYHQTTRVVINIRNAEAATSASQIQSVVIGNNNLALSGTYTKPTGSNTGGTWSTVAATSTITPKEITATGSNILKSYAALVIPQNMQNQKFIAVTLSDGNTYYYIPIATDGANLKAGQQRTYNITVKRGYLDVVTASDDGGVWGGGEEVTVNSII